MLFTRKMFFFLCCVVILGAVSADICPGAVYGGKKAEESYRLTKNNGPWLIMAMVFADENPNVAYQKAENLVKELRANRDFITSKMTAYIYEKDNRDSKISEGRPRWYYDEKSEQLKLTKGKYVNRTVVTEFAVMIGDFRMDGRDEKRIADALKKVRTASPKSTQSGQASHPLFRAEEARRETSRPMQYAFMTPNPLLPPENFIKTGLDETVLNANKGIKQYSLLDCPGKYSVQVAVLKGASTLNQQKIVQAMSDDKLKWTTDQTLTEADEKAVKLCDALRERGYEAYVFRDHYASIVTIGSFDSIGETMNNEMKLDPQIEMIFKKFSATCDTSRGLAGIRRETIDGIPFDVTPKIIVVPRRPLVNTGFATYGR